MKKIKTTFQSFVNESYNENLRMMNLISSPDITIDSSGLLYDSEGEPIDNIIEIDRGLIKEEDIEPIVNFIAENEEDLIELVEYEHAFSLYSLELDEDEVEQSRKNTNLENAKKFLREVLEQRL